MALRVEPFIHAVSLFIGFVPAIAGIFLKLYNNANLWCWIAPLPSQSSSNMAVAQCDNYEFDGDNEVPSCDEEEDAAADTNATANNHAMMYRWIFYYGPLWASLIAALLSLGCLTIALNDRELKLIQSVNKQNQDKKQQQQKQPQHPQQQQQQQPMVEETEESPSSTTDSGSGFGSGSARGAFKTTSSSSPYYNASFVINTPGTNVDGEQHYVDEDENATPIKPADKMKHFLNNMVGRQILSCGLDHDDTNDRDEDAFGCAGSGHDFVIWNFGGRRRSSSRRRQSSFNSVSGYSRRESSSRSSIITKATASFSKRKSNNSNRSSVVSIDSVVSNAIRRGSSMVAMSSSPDMIDPHRHQSQGSMNGSIGSYNDNIDNNNNKSPACANSANMVEEDDNTDRPNDSHGSSSSLITSRRARTDEQGPQHEEAEEEGDATNLVAQGSDDSMDQTRPRGIRERRPRDGGGRQRRGQKRRHPQLPARRESFWSRASTLVANTTTAQDGGAAAEQLDYHHPLIRTSSVCTTTSAISRSSSTVASTNTYNNKRTSSRSANRENILRVFETIQNLPGVSQAAQTMGSRAIYRQAVWYTVVFYITFTAATINRLIQGLFNRSLYTLLVLHTIFVPLQVSLSEKSSW